MYLLSLSTLALLKCLLSLSFSPLSVFFMDAYMYVFGGGGDLRGGERESSERVTKRPQEELTTGFPKAVCLKASAEFRLQSSCATPCA